MVVIRGGGSEGLKDKALWWLSGGVRVSKGLTEVNIKLASDIVNDSGDEPCACQLEWAFTNLSGIFEIGSCFGSQKSFWFSSCFKHSPLVNHDRHLSSKYII